MSSSRRGLLWIALLLFAALAAFLFFGRQQPPAEPPAAPAETVVELAESDVAIARAGDIGRVLRANGTLRAVNQSVVRAKVAGEIVEVAAREGERVAAGQVLAQIERSEYQSRLKERIAAQDAARSQALLSEASRRKNQELLAKGFISTLAYDNARSAAEVGAAQARAQEALVELAKKALDDTVVRAPISGWVAERAVSRGDKTGIDGKLFTLVDLTRLELEALVPANEIAHLAVGQQFVTTVEGFGEQRFPGRVARIGPSAQAGNRSLPIYIEIDNPQAALKTGVFAEGSVELGRIKATALVPTSALRNESGVNVVYVLEGDRVKRQRVEIGLVSEREGLVDIVQGVAVGARVISANLGALKEGARVRFQANSQANAPAPKQNRAVQ